MDETSRTGAALLLIDVINDMDFQGGEPLLAAATGIVDRIEALIRDAREAEVPVIYVNDNFDQWHSDRDRLVEHCLRTDAPGRDIVARLRPRENDYFTIKPEFSGFYATNLPVLLPKLNVDRLILAGVAADICVLFTAADAHMRDYRLWVPRDVVASEEECHRDWALGIMEHSMAAEIRSTKELHVTDWLDAR